jgi:hypothetical protein
MSVLLITYELNKSGKVYSDLLKIIKSYPYAQLSESSYAILTDKTPATIYAELKPSLDKNDYIYIITLNRPYSGSGLTIVNEWLESSLTY